MKKIWKRALMTGLLLAASAWLGGVSLHAGEEIDMKRALGLLKKSKTGEKLTPAEQEYLDKAKAARKKGGGKNVSNGDKGNKGDRDEFEQAQKIAKKKRAGEEITAEEQAIMKKYSDRGWLADMDPTRTSTGLIPLCDMKASDRYKGEDGGLYGKGKNTPDAEHQVIIEKVLREIKPRDSAGEASPQGKIVMISVGMSNTTREFGVFVRAASADKRKAPAVTIVDCAQGSQAGKQWAEKESVWQNVQKKLQLQKVTPSQVQVAWVKLAEMRPSAYGAFPKHVEYFKGNITRILQRLKKTCPNLAVVYFSSRVYAGYAVGDRSLNPEPYAYESAYALRWLILEQLKGASELNYDSAKGKVEAPLLLWGPYMWCDGMKPSRDGLTWPPELLDFDGVHPSGKGKEKITQLLLDFFTTNKNAKPWFTDGGK